MRSKKTKKNADVIYGLSLTLFVAWENLAQIASVFHYDAQKMMGIRILNIRLSLCSFLIPKWIMLRDQKILKYYANKHTNNSSFLLPNISWRSRHSGVPFILGSLDGRVFLQNIFSYLFLLTNENVCKATGSETKIALTIAFPSPSRSFII